MYKGIKNLIINEEKFKEISSNKKKLSKKIIKGLLALTLVTGGYIYREPIINFLQDNIVIVDSNKGFGGLDLGVMPEGAREVNGKVYDLAQLQEEYGVYYPLVVPMTKEEISKQYQKLVLFLTKTHDNTTAFSNFGYNLKITDMPEGTITEFNNIETNIFRKLYKGEIMPSNPFMQIVQKNTSCWTGEFAGCQMHPSIEDGIYDFSRETIREYSNEYFLRFWLFKFEIWNRFVESKGYNLEDYIPFSRTK